MAAAGMAELVELEQLHLVNSDWPQLEDKSRKPKSNGASGIQARRPLAMPVRRRRRRQ
jgi:hypothetical protein